MATHVRVLAALLIVFGALGLLAGLIVLLVFGGLAALVGMTDSSDGRLVAIPILGGIGGIVFLITLIVSLPDLIAGIGLLRYRPWARVLSIILCAISLLHVPFGTALGVYGLWVLLSPEGERVFHERA